MIEQQTMEFARVLKDKIRVLMNDKSDAMIGGGCVDYAAYKELVGVVYGLALAERELLDLLQTAKGDET